MAISTVCGQHKHDLKRVKRTEEHILRIYIILDNPPPGGATARGGPWPPLQYGSRSLGSLLYLSIRLYPSFSGPWTRHPAISFLVFLFVLLHTTYVPSTRPAICGVRCATMEVLVLHQ